MRARFAVACSLLFLPSPASAVITTDVAHVNMIPPGQAATLGPICGARFVVGGGFDTVDGDVIQLSQSYDNEFGSWVSSAFNSGQSPGDFSSVAICSDSGPIPHVAQKHATLTGPGVLLGGVPCGEGEVAVSGGLSAGGAVDTRWTRALAPLWPASTLASEPDGQRSAPTGWGLKEESVSSDPIDVWGQVTCEPRDDVIAVVASGVAIAGSVTSKTVICPTDFYATGGGADAIDSTGLRLVASAPVFFGLPTTLRITDLTGGTNLAPPIGWRVALRNTSDTARPIKAAAVCVPAPEPGSVALEVCAALALAAVKRSAPR